MLGFGRLAGAALALGLAAAPASADVTFKLVNESEQHPKDVYITLFCGSAPCPNGGTGTLSGGGTLGMNAATSLQHIPGNTFTITSSAAQPYTSGNLLVAFGGPGITVNGANGYDNDPVNGKLRFGMAEFTAPGGSSFDISYVNQFGIPLRAEVANPGKPVQTLGAVCDGNSTRRLFEQISGSSGAIKTGANGEFLRYVGPSKLGPNPDGSPGPTATQPWPSLDRYIRSLVGTTIEITTASNGAGKFTGKIALGANGDPTITMVSEGGAHDDVTVELSSQNVYWGAGPITVNGSSTTDLNTPQGAIYNRLVTGFAFGFWGGKFGNSFTDNFWADKAPFEGAQPGSPFTAPDPRYSPFNQVIFTATNATAYGFTFGETVRNPAVDLDDGATVTLTILPDELPPGQEPSFCPPPAPTPQPAGQSAPGSSSGPPPPPPPPPSPSTGKPVCNAQPTRKPGTKGRITVNKQAFVIQQRLDQAALVRLNAVNEWIDAGIVPTDLCADAFGQAPFQAGIPWVGGAVAPALSPPTPRPLTRAKRRTAKPGEFTASVRQARINANISAALFARALATRKRISSLTGGNLAPGANLAGRPLFAGMQVGGPLPASSSPPPTPLEIGKPPKAGKVTLSAKQLRDTQRQSQRAITVANSVTDQITSGLTEANFQPGSIGASHL